MTTFVVELPGRVGVDGRVGTHGPVSVTVDVESLVADEWALVAASLADYAMATGVEPDVEVKAAAVALQVIRRDPTLAGVAFGDLVQINEYRPGWSSDTLAGLDGAQRLELARMVSR